MKVLLFDVSFILTSSPQHRNKHHWKLSLHLCLFTGEIRLQLIWSTEQELRFIINLVDETRIATPIYTWSKPIRWFQKQKYYAIQNWGCSNFKDKLFASPLSSSNGYSYFVVKTVTRSPFLPKNGCMPQGQKKKCIWFCTYLFG